MSVRVLIKETTQFLNTKGSAYSLHGNNSNSFMDSVPSTQFSYTC